MPTIDCTGNTTSRAEIEVPAKRNMISNLFSKTNKYYSMVNPTWVAFRPEKNNKALQFEVT